MYYYVVPKPNFPQLIKMLSCYRGLMCSSCSCSKFKHRLPAPMNCMVGNDRPVHLYSSAECGTGDVIINFISASPRCFTEDDRPLRHGSSFNQQKLWGGMIAIYFAQVFVFITSITVISCLMAWWFCWPQFWSVLCLSITLFQVLSCLFFFRLNSNICFICVVAASASAASSLAQQASLHSMKDYHGNYSA